jgi:hypothetical protein
MCIIDSTKAIEACQSTDQSMGGALAGLRRPGKTVNPQLEVVPRYDINQPGVGFRNAAVNGSEGQRA